MKTAKYILEVPSQPSRPFGMDDAIHAVNNGAWAVLVASGIIFVVSRKALGNYVKAQIEMSASLRDTVKSNSETLKTQSETLRALGQTQLAITDMLKNLHQAQLNTDDTVDMLALRVPEIQTRQQRMIGYLKAIADKLEVKPIMPDEDE